MIKGAKDIKKGDVFIYKYDVSDIQGYNSIVNTYLGIVTEIKLTSLGTAFEAIDICFINKVSDRSEYKLQTAPYLVDVDNNVYEILEVLKNFNGLAEDNIKEIELWIRDTRPELFV